MCWLRGNLWSGGLPQGWAAAGDDWNHLTTIYILYYIIYINGFMNSWFALPTLSPRAFRSNLQLIMYLGHPGVDLVLPCYACGVTQTQWTPCRGQKK